MPAAGRADKLGSLFNRFGTIELGPLRARGSTGDVHDGSSGAQFNGDAASGATSCTRDQCHLALEVGHNDSDLFEITL
jgi:hypothetical protein